VIGLRGSAIATHPRVAQRLQETGFLHVMTAAADDSSVIDQLESIKG
jgi:hypothetical protein